MIPEYKLYHGAVLMELVTGCERGVRIREVVDDGARSASYVINDRVALHIKYASSRLRPWQFKFSQPNFLSLADAYEQLGALYLALVCWTDGIICLSFPEVLGLVHSNGPQRPRHGQIRPDQSWIRADRLKGHLYTISGLAGELSTKRPSGLGPLLGLLSEGS